jgi:hypothetical protein
MRLSMNGWLRLLVLLSILWLGCLGVAIYADTLLPKFHSWVFTATPTPADPLGLFPRIVWSRLLSVAGIPLAFLWLSGWLTSWIFRGFAERETSTLLVPGRLQDVLALVQVLALDKDTDRSASGLVSELQGPPRSAGSWAEVASSHPEFFRYQPNLEHGVSLVSRHVLSKNEQGFRELPVDFAGKLLSLAVELHDRQLRRARAWEVFIPLIVAALGGAIGLITIAIKP